jgi:hemoglobin
MRKWSIVVTALCACTAFAVVASAQEKTLCDRLGGTPAISAVVDSFAGKVLKDERINKKFAKSDANRLVVNLKAQIGAAAKCPGVKYTGKSMKASHKNMAVTEGEFNALAEDLVKTLDEFKVPEKEKSDLLAAIGPMKKDIVEKPGDLQTSSPVEDKSLYEEDVARLRRAYAPVSFCKSAGNSIAPALFFSAAAIKVCSLALPATGMHLEMRIRTQAVKWNEGTAPAMRLQCFALFSTPVTALLPARDNDGGQFLLRRPGTQGLP